MVLLPGSCQSSAKRLRGSNPSRIDDFPNTTRSRSGCGATSTSNPIVIHLHLVNYDFLVRQIFAENASKRSNNDFNSYQLEAIETQQKSLACCFNLFKLKYPRLAYTL